MTAGGTGRDRDPAGRPRNARPRDALGRPLPRGAAGAGRIPDDLALPPAEALELAQHLLEEGRPFHAHEVLEASWKQAPDGERELWRGLAQIAVGLRTRSAATPGGRWPSCAGSGPGQRVRHRPAARHRRRGRRPGQLGDLAARIEAAGDTAVFTPGPGIRLTRGGT